MCLHNYLPIPLYFEMWRTLQNFSTLSTNCHKMLHFVDSLISFKMWRNLWMTLGHGFQKYFLKFIKY